MDDLQVRIVELEPLRVASLHAYSATPEHDAWDKLVAWAEPKGLLADRASYRVFGFNNPDPSPGSPNYGYEFWITVGPDVEAGGEVQIRDFGGGLYAVTRCVGIPQLIETWPRLVTWVEDSGYRPASHQWLEESLSPIGTPDTELLMDLYMPVRYPADRNRSWAPAFAPLPLLSLGETATAFGPQCYGIRPASPKPGANQQVWLVRSIDSRHRSLEAPRCQPCAHHGDHLDRGCGAPEGHSLKTLRRLHLPSQG